jgi:cytochrome P450
LEAGQELTSIMDAIGEQRLSHPTDDVTTALVTANVDGEALTRSELAAFFILLVVAGSDTTRNTTSQCLVALDGHPDQRAQWQREPERLTPTAVDEVVRWATPVNWMRRTTGEPTVLAGQEIPAGEKVVIFYNSGNRDETVFDDPWRLDLTRSPNPHLGFGGGGPHFCLGAALARREIGVMWRELFNQLPDIHATAPPDRLQSSFINGIKHLPCAWTPPA